MYFITCLPVYLTLKCAVQKMSRVTYNIEHFNTATACYSIKDQVFYLALI